MCVPVYRSVFVLKRVLVCSCVCAFVLHPVQSLCLSSVIGDHGPIMTCHYGQLSTVVCPDTASSSHVFFSPPKI